MQASTAAFGQPDGIRSVRRCSRHLECPFNDGLMRPSKVTANTLARDADSSPWPVNAITFERAPAGAIQHAAERAHQALVVAEPATRLE